MVIFYVKVGAELKDLDNLEKIFRNATLQGTEKVPLRPNAVDPFIRKNVGNNLFEDVREKVEKNRHRGFTENWVCKLRAGRCPCTT
ncbi:MAG: fumarate hydratase [Thermoproteota archaeon]|nr:fumarate hydratase [Thermoproteota archaeon]